MRELHASRSVLKGTIYANTCRICSSDETMFCLFKFVGSISNDHRIWMTRVNLHDSHPRSPYIPHLIDPIFVCLVIDSFLTFWRAHCLIKCFKETTKSSMGQTTISKHTRILQSMEDPAPQKFQTVKFCKVS